MKYGDLWSRPTSVCFLSSSSFCSCRIYAWIAIFRSVFMSSMLYLSIQWEIQCTQQNTGNAQEVEKHVMKFAPNGDLGPRGIVLSVEKAKSCWQKGKSLCLHREIHQCQRTSPASQHTPKVCMAAHQNMSSSNSKGGFPGAEGELVVGGFLSRLRT